MKILQAGRNRLANGRFAPGVSGNPKGVPVKPEIAELRKALAMVETAEGKSFLQHFVEKAYTDTHVAIALAKKIIPDLVLGEGFDAKTFIYNLINFSGNGSKPANPEKTVGTEHAETKAITPAE